VLQQRQQQQLPDRILIKQIVRRSNDAEPI
jgi:hypothetical protein